MHPKPLLHLEDLHVEVSGTPILQSIDLTVQAGKVYALMGPNGAGKSTLAAVLAGKPGYTITKGKATFLEKDLLSLTPEKRAAAGLFMAFQQPATIPGVRIIHFLKTAINQIRLAQGLPQLTALQLLTLVKEKIQWLGMDPALLHKPLNENFSGGEKKLNELLQMAVLTPKLAILDEIDSGLDIDSLRLLGRVLQQMRGPDNAIIIITHYPRLFQYITPDVVHVLQQGRIVQSSDAKLAYTLLEKGYEELKKTL